MALKLLVTTCGIQFPDQGLNPGPLHWECRPQWVWNTREVPGKYQFCTETLGGSDGKESACSTGDWAPSLGQEDLLEKGMATYSIILAWRIPWTAKAGGLQSMGLLRVKHN